MGAHVGDPVGLASWRSMASARATKMLSSSSILRSGEIIGDNAILGRDLNTLDMSASSLNNFSRGVDSPDPGVRVSFCKLDFRGVSNGLTGYSCESLGPPDLRLVVFLSVIVVSKDIDFLVRCARSAATGLGNGDGSMFVVPLSIGFAGCVLSGLGELPRSRRAPARDMRVRSCRVIRGFGTGVVGGDLQSEVLISIS
jgi:hypothetical protein